MIVSIGIVLVCTGISIWTIYTILSLAPWFPTRTSDIERIGKLSRPQEGETFYDLGSGDGRVILTLAKQYPLCTFCGYEMSLTLFLYSWIRLKYAKVPNVSFKWKNGLTQDYTKASVVYIFATHRTLNATPLKRVISDLPVGARILSYNFRIENWVGKHSKDKPKGQTPIYIYTKQ